jgi:hypothetical protein
MQRSEGTGRLLLRNHEEGDGRVFPSHASYRTVSLHTSESSSIPVIHTQASSMFISENALVVLTECLYIQI